MHRRRTSSAAIWINSRGAERGLRVMEGSKGAGMLRPREEMRESIHSITFSLVTEAARSLG